MNKSSEIELIYFGAPFQHFSTTMRIKQAANNFQNDSLYFYAITINFICAKTIPYLKFQSADFFQNICVLM